MIALVRLNPYFFGRIVRSARSRSRRAISTGSPRGLEQYLVRRRADLGLDDLDGQVFLLAADESRDSLPDARGALVGVHGQHGARLPYTPSNCPPQ